MAHTFIWIICFTAIAGVIIRPFKTTETLWAVAGALLLIVLRLLDPSEGLKGVIKGLDVYLFLLGMMLLAETAREEKLFDWMAAHAVKYARGSSNRLFLLVYVIGLIVTTFLSNDATAVVLTPAVAAAMKAAKVDKPLPYLFICAFIANAASFVLPISNPANLVIYGSHPPALLAWVKLFLLPSICSIVATYAILRFILREKLRQNIETDIQVPDLSPGGITAFTGIIITAVILLGASAFNIQLGVPTVVTGIITSVIVITRSGKNPLTVVKGVSWSVFPLVAGLFVIVQALNQNGLTGMLSGVLHEHIARSPANAAFVSGLVTAYGSNFMNNLPAGLIAGNVIQSGNVPDVVKSAMLIGIDLGPNLSVTGSLATILWLIALRRENQYVNFWSFLRLGLVVMTIPLLLTLVVVWLIS